MAHYANMHTRFDAKRLRPCGVLLGLVLIVGCLAFVPMRSTIASQSAGHNHPNATESVIDGRVNPEMIQDRDAYRLFFLSLAASVSAGSEPGEMRRVDAVFNALNLSVIEKQDAKLILMDFKQKHDALAAKFNSTAETIPGPRH